MFKRHPIILAAAVACLGAPPALVPAGAQGLPPGAQQSVPTISPAELKDLMRTKQRLVIVDVRQPEEYAAGHIDGAVLMPLDKLPATYRQIPKGVRLVVNCRSGVRSAKAVAFLRAHGYSQAVSLAGGYMAWQGR